MRYEMTRPMDSPNPRLRHSGPLRDRADDLLVAFAVLGFVATIVDGEADYREVERFTREFRRRFALSRSHSLRLIGAALQHIRLAGERTILEGTCDTLNEHLTREQKLSFIDLLAELIVADGKVHEGEEYYLEYIAQRLDVDVVRQLGPNLP